MDANQNKQYGQSALMVLLFLWWITAWYIERIDFLARPVTIPVLADFVNPIIQSFPASLQFVLELFSFRVLRHLVPFALGWWLARRGALALIQDLYDLPNQGAAQGFLARSQSTEAPQGAPVSIRRTDFAKDRLNNPLLRYGGPGRIRVKQGDVVWTERNGRFQNVYGSGMHKLNRYENVRGALDLRTQERVDAKVTLITEDGIELETTLAVVFHIGRGERLVTEQEPYPFEDEAIYLAGYAETLLIDDHIDNWETLPMKLTTAVLRDIVARKTLDRLLYPSNPELRPHEIIKERMDRLSRAELGKWGIDLVSTRLGALQVPNMVTQQRIEHWQQHWQQRH
ncbi:MAG: hypothetical protein F6K62_24320, partial [Sphaerospermopsis sp. SIO1G2]|nr:hypothetical protein [Sphaerospermopsis sp. SIO1G2]